MGNTIKLTQPISRFRVLKCMSITITHFKKYDKSASRLMILTYTADIKLRIINEDFTIECVDINGPTSISSTNMEVKQKVQPN